MNRILACYNYRDNMRSKGDGVDSSANGVLVVPCAIHEISEEQEEDMKLQVTEKSIKAKVQQKEKEEMLMSESEDKSIMKDNQRLDLKDLSKDDLLKLLGIMEGEIQVKFFIVYLKYAEVHQKHLEQEVNHSGTLKTSTLYGYHYNARYTEKLHLCNNLFFAVTY